ncbi:MAG: DNA polymerase IV [Firmicutes bacterium]|nr:DNA polymerase IV [Bacillota bacterium]
MSQDRTILHCDMNGFYASVELLQLPHLKDLPVAVCGNPESRHGIILAKNDHAKKFGIVTAETVWQAKKKCPELVLVPPHHRLYKEYSLKINEIYLRFTDMVEPFSIDESWLDVTGSLKLFGTGKEIGDRIRELVREELGLTLSVGVSYNKVFAKMGSDYKKPDATTVISRENYRNILWPLPVGELFFVGQATSEKLNQMGITTIGQLAQSQPQVLNAVFGKHGQQMYEYANGLENSPVLRYDEQEDIKSVGNGITFRRNLEGEKDIAVAVTALADKVASRLRAGHVKCAGVKVDIKDPMFHTISRQKQLDQPTNTAVEIRDHVMDLIRKSWKLNDPIRLLTVTGINLRPENEAVQLSLFDTVDQRREKNEKMERTMDSIRQKFGGGAITYGGLMRNDIGIDIEEEKPK